jgi:hypothetical protein
MVVGMAEMEQCCDKPFHMKKEGRSTQDTLAEPDLGGITHFRWNTFLLMDRTSPRRFGHHLERVSM